LRSPTLTGGAWRLQRFLTNDTDGWTNASAGRTDRTDATQR